MEMEVRPLLVTDVFTLARMLSKMTKGARAELVEALQPGKSPEPMMVGMALFQSLFIDVEEDLKAWLASLIGKAPSEFEKMPATAVIDLIEALAKQEDLRDFFERVSLLMSTNLST